MEVSSAVPDSSSIHTSWRLDTTYHRCSHRALGEGWAEEKGERTGRCGQSRKRRLGCVGGP